MQLGFMTAILPDLDLEGVLRTAQQIGYECIEVMCWPKGKATRRYAGITHIDVASLDPTTVDQIRNRQDEAGVRISALGYYPNPLTPDSEESERSVAQILAVIEAASKLGIGKMNTFVGRDWTKNVDDNWPRFLEVWKPIIEHAEKHQVRVGIENCPMFFTNDEWPAGKNLAHSPAIWQRMFDDINSDHFGLNYDPSHMIFQQMDYLSPMREFADKLFHIHAKDVRVDRARLDRVGILANPNEYHSPKLPGMGDVDWGKFFSTLTDTGYDGPVCVEVEDRAYEGSDQNCLRALQQSYNFLRSYVV
ncbi:sugar phosphate isomerase/epimerase [Roseiconus nitratireducens]|uniref:Sugar phosphate isomerase/epimerase n=1 Tax=Roseiconus nitratireducens TaxID=2605748 RepID=A0A5M6DF65_9BACT|nr:sugar phosphate isomerase/epimerase family protein [Roseiconus nitratireducens]KAA5546187.1 sugar phosphate isomerase/epimerase [Roseiconus nitratireducens]